MTRHNPWKVLGSRIVYENQWIRVREDSVIRPDGAPGIYGVVETRVAVGIVALTPEGELYLVGQYRYPTDNYSWEIIEGGTEDGEDPLATAKRELAEEAGLLASRWDRLGGEIHLSNCISSERAVLYVARDLEVTEAAPEGTEILEITHVPVSRAREMIGTGEITDALSIIAILQIESWLRTHF